MSAKRRETHVLAGSFELQRLQMNQTLELINDLNFIIPFEFLVSSCGIWLETCFKSFQCLQPTDTEHCTLSADRANNTPLAPPDNGLSLEDSTGLFSEDFLFRFCCLNLDHFSGPREVFSMFINALLLSLTLLFLTCEA